MHRAGGSFYMLALSAALALCAPSARAVPVTSLYVVVVPGSDPMQAEQAAMRVELVRLIGSRDAASDPALAMLIDNARQYVQLERATTTGEFQVLFDESALSAAIGAAGRTLWAADRPLLWIELPPLDAATAAAMRMRLSAAADERGLPITIVSPDAGNPPAGAPAGASANAPASGAAPAPAPGSKPAATAPAVPAPAVPAPAAAAPAAAIPATPTPAVPASAASASPGAPASGVAAASGTASQDALEAARTAGASAALVARVEPSQPGMLQWTLVSPDTAGQWVGSPELAIDAATDELAGASRALEQGPVAQYDCHVDGVSDLSGLVNVLAVVNAAPGVTQVAVSEVQGDQLILRLQARGSEPQLQRALESERLQAAGTGSQGELLYRYVDEPATESASGAAAPSGGTSGPDSGTSAPGPAAPAAPPSAAPPPAAPPPGVATR